MTDIINKVKKHGISGSLQVCYNYFYNYIKRYAEKRRIKKAKLASDDCYILKEVQGSKMLLNLSDVGISRELFFTGVHEAESTKQFKEEICSGMTIFELGANIGYYALIGAQRIGASGKIIAFEPSPINMQAFKTNISLNNYERLVETYQMGIGNKTGKMMFNLVNKGNMSSFHERADGGGIKTFNSIEVNVTTIDDFVKDRLEKIDYMRMDVEGYEYEIFQGMKNFLKSEFAPNGFFIEVHSQLLNQNGHSCKEFVTVLGNYGYYITTARWRGKADVIVFSKKELFNHPLCEEGYWEVFFKK